VAKLTILDGPDLRCLTLMTHLNESERPSLVPEPLGNEGVILRPLRRGHLRLRRPHFYRGADAPDSIAHRLSCPFSVNGPSYTGSIATRTTFVNVTDLGQPHLMSVVPARCPVWASSPSEVGRPDAVPYRKVRATSGGPLHVTPGITCRGTATTVCRAAPQ
jgi:hypothetical protein